LAPIHDLEKEPVSLALAHDHEEMVSQLAPACDQEKETVSMAPAHD
jgi:hypothetical protein